MKTLQFVLALAVVSGSLLTKPAAQAATDPKLAPLQLRQQANQLVVELALPADKLVIEQNGQILETREYPAAQEQFALADPSGTYLVRLLDQAQQEIARASWKAAPTAAAGASLQMHVSANQVFGSSINPLLVSASPGELKVLLDGQVIHSQSLEHQGTHVLPKLAISPGRHQLQMQLLTSAKTLSTPALQVFSFGVEPLDHSYLLADKYTFSLYWIRQGVLHRIYPVATGRPSLPTQPGFWLIGAKDVFFPQSDWGSYRLRIYRENQYPHHWSGYAVHGTNRPNSIGTEASHGCLRMYNQDVTELYQGISVGTPLLIMEKMPAYIEKL